MKKFIFTTAFSLLATIGFSQWSGKEYVVENDPAVLEKLDEWQDLKLGFFVHWGAYSVDGLCESWPVVSEDVDWLTPHADIRKFREHYFNELPLQFNPTGFNPDQWAELAEEMGAKYFVFTTKHHDGFTMWDSKQTEYKITNPKFPYANAKYADITGSLFEAMRAKNMMIGAYISKPDWHHPYYWSPSFDSPGRNVNYKIERHPDWWRNFTDFFYNQVEELMTDYGNVDILWLDGAWADKNNQGQDMKMDEVGQMCREKQPGILVVDRWVGGRWENYRTPEQHIPSESNPIPWETCMTVNCCFSYRFEDSNETNVKSGRQLTHKFIDIVSKGGNLLLNLGASPQGWFNKKEVEAVRNLGQWIKLNSEAIYATRAIAPFAEANVRYTRSKDNSKVYAIVLLEDGEMPDKAMLPGCLVAKRATIKDVATGKTVAFSRQGNATLVDIPKKKGTAQYAVAFEISEVEKMAGKAYGKSQAAKDAENRNL
ncbi:alpha-L-fucosidase [Carboxylicivirga sp. A043]|uniref:alpha-L-fucosidase n=1 Tax=Carboxylicivirga litoralis TaxID=2816963 RepID=UPI0021CAED53|nr:alpha-L-fucosidase [Carboxylicivirga sp. A043]MCU4156364.1 alpha-L-fucosidase [Carboxylicivirga sp. A043]